MKVEFTAVVVTFNRLKCLKNALDSFENQIKKPSNIIVVNNASNDGTFEYLEDWKNENSEINKIVVHKDENSGGSGGFYEGLKVAKDMDAEWIWLSDDDAYPKNDVFKLAEDYIENNDTSDISAICSKIINNGEIDTWHRRRMSKGLIKIRWENVPEKDYDDCFELDLLSYVGCIIKKEKLLKAGLTNKDYFIWYDDSEHSIRLRKEGRIVCVPEIVTIHNVKADREINWKYYYAIRNYNDM